MTEHEPTRRPVDPRAVAIAGLSTLAWYAVPDVVRPRWARGLAKATVGTACLALTMTSTRDGQDAREGVRSVRDAVRASAEGAAGDARAEDGVDAEAPGGVREDNTYAPDRGDQPLPAPPGVLVAGALGGLALAVTLVVAGEKWVYRRGERLRSRGARLPHTRVGLAMGAVAAALAAVEPFLGTDADAA
jgi:hypothetical protein